MRLFNNLFATFGRNARICHMSPCRNCRKLQTTAQNRPHTQQPPKPKRNSPKGFVVILIAHGGVLRKATAWLTQSLRVTQCRDCEGTLVYHVRTVIAPTKKAELAAEPALRLLGAFRFPARGLVGISQN